MWEYKYEGHSTTTFIEAALRAISIEIFFILVRSDNTYGSIAVAYQFRVNGDRASDKKIVRDVQLVF